jgi:homoserine O-acetyltransferase
MRSLAACLLLVAPLAAATFPEPKEADFTIRDFHFASGETLPELRQHYRTIGEIRRNAQGVVTNAVLIMHGTGGTGRAFTSERFGGLLFGPGQTLDATKYFIILPDGIGHGGSSKPSEGLRMKFPHYGYTDMVEAQYRLVTEGLKVNHLRLVMGTSMGAMHTWVWGERYPAFMDALMPLASAPVQIAGRNRMFRRMIMDAIRNDPEWNNGDYTKEPRGMDDAFHTLFVMTSAPLYQHSQAPTRDQADKLIEDYIANQRRNSDANDMLYQYDASRDYDPSKDLEKIQAVLFAVNSADDQVNPPELGILEREIKGVKRGRYILLPITPETRGHGTHSIPAIWGKYLDELMQQSAPTTHF